jgi:hypothetical protein
LGHFCSGLKMTAAVEHPLHPGTDLVPRYPRRPIDPTQPSRAFSHLRLVPASASGRLGRTRGASAQSQASSGVHVTNDCVWHQGPSTSDVGARETRAHCTAARLLQPPMREGVAVSVRLDSGCHRLVMPGQACRRRCGTGSLVSAKCQEGGIWAAESGSHFSTSILGAGNRAPLEP